MEQVVVRVPSQSSLPGVLVGGTACSPFRARRCARGLEDSRVRVIEDDSSNHLHLCIR